jgi:CheY-like chemotaxis protein
VASALVVGEPGDDRALLRQALEGAGLAVQESPAPPGAEQVRGASLIVLDEPETLAPMRRGPPVIVLSRCVDIDSFSNAVTLGAAAYLVKPVDAAELAEVAGRLARWRQGTAQGGRRLARRRPLFIDVDLEPAARAAPMRGRLLDVSASGCRVEVPAPGLSAGEALRVIPRALSDTTGIALGAQVRWRRKVPGGAQVAALRFNGTSALLAGRIFGTPLR